MNFFTAPTGSSSPCLPDALACQHFPACLLQLSTSGTLPKFFDIDVVAPLWVAVYHSLRFLLKNAMPERALKIILKSAAGIMGRHVPH